MKHHNMAYNSPEILVADNLVRRGGSNNESECDDEGPSKDSSSFYRFDHD